MNKRKRSIIGCTFILMVMLLSGCGSNSAKNEITKAEAFTMKNLQGQEVKLSDYKGKQVYIKYWASWCPICLEGLKDINTLSSEDQDFVILTMVAPNLKSEKNSEDFKTWFQGVENTEHIQVLFDEDGEYMKKLGIRGFPSSQWIDKEGNSVRFTTGHVDNEMVKAGFQ